MVVFPPPDSWRLPDTRVSGNWKEKGGRGEDEEVNFYSRVLIS